MADYKKKMIHIFISIMLIITILLIILPSSFGRLPAGHILSEKTQLEIDGAEIGLILLSDNTDAPVLLVCGGGPGIPQYLMESLYPSVLPEFLLYAISTTGERVYLITKIPIRAK